MFITDENTSSFPIPLGIVYLYTKNLPSSTIPEGLNVRNQQLCINIANNY